MEALLEPAMEESLMRSFFRGGGSRGFGGYDDFVWQNRTPNAYLDSLGSGKLPHSNLTLDKSPPPLRPESSPTASLGTGLGKRMSSSPMKGMDSSTAFLGFTSALGPIGSLISSAISPGLQRQAREEYDQKVDASLLAAGFPSAAKYVGPATVQYYNGGNNFTYAPRMPGMNSNVSNWSSGNYRT